MSRYNNKNKFTKRFYGIMPKGFSDREKEIIRARLLEKARECFVTFGLKKTSLEDLTQAAGISKSAFYVFYDSKEALFFEILEEAEHEFRELVMTEVPAQVGQAPHQRFKRVFQIAFQLWKTMPILQTVSRADYELLLGKLPPEKIQDHLQSDQVFVFELLERFRQSGVDIAADPGQIAGLMNAMFFVTLHEKDFGPEMYAGTVDLLLDLIAGYCVGEVKTS